MASQVDAAAQSSPTTQSQVNTTRRLSRRRHEAKARKYDGNDIATRDAENDFAEFEVERRKRLELRVNRLYDERAAAWRRLRGHANRFVARDLSKAWNSWLEMVRRCCTAPVAPENATCATPAYYNC